MPWIGGLIGLFLGCVLGSLAGGMVLTALGVALGVLVFLARGEGPFSVAWGSPSAADAALAVNTLIPNYRDGQPLPASPAALKAAAAMAAPSTVPGTGHALPPQCPRVCYGACWSPGSSFLGQWQLSCSGK